MDDHSEIGDSKELAIGSLSVSREHNEIRVVSQWRNSRPLRFQSETQESSIGTLAPDAEPANINSSKRSVFALQLGNVQEAQIL